MIRTEDPQESESIELHLLYSCIDHEHILVLETMVTVMLLATWMAARSTMNLTFPTGSFTSNVVWVFTLTAFLIGSDGLLVIGTLAMLSGFLLTGRFWLNAPANSFKILYLVLLIIAISVSILSPSIPDNSIPVSNFTMLVLFCRQELQYVLILNLIRLFRVRHLFGYLLMLPAIVYAYT